MKRRWRKKHYQKALIWCWFMSLSVSLDLRSSVGVDDMFYIRWPRHSWAVNYCGRPILYHSYCSSESELGLRIGATSQLRTSSYFGVDFVPVDSIEADLIGTSETARYQARGNLLPYQQFNLINFRKLLHSYQLWFYKLSSDTPTPPSKWNW